jgi:chloramphenicol 3-O phosphotransferase
VSPGQIVVLNGAPRSGKSSIAAVIQETFEGLWVNLGVDVARSMTPARYQPDIGLRPGETEHPAASVVPVLFAALYESIAAHANEGVNVVADIGHHDVAVLCDCARRLAGRRAVLVGLRCPIDVVMERRNASEPGRYATGAPDDLPAPVRRWQHDVHVPGVYDLEVDTSVMSPEECAVAIRGLLVDTVTPTAFERLAASDS